MPTLQNFRNFAGNTVAALGGSLKLPELGISELIGNQPRPGTPVLNAPYGFSPTREQQLSLAAPYVSSARSGTPVNVGSSPAPSSTGGGDSRLDQLRKIAAGGGLNPAQLSEYQGLLESIPAFENQDIDINPALSALAEAENAARSSLEAERSGIETFANRSIGEQESALGQATASADKARLRGRQEEERAINESRRQQSELQQGIQARYGGTTATGAFVSEIIGSQTLRNIGQYRQQYSNFIADVDEKLETTQLNAAKQIREINESKENKLLQLKANFDQTMATIAGQRGQLRSQQALARQQAVQNYMSEVSGINARNKSFLQNIYVQLQEEQSQLNAAKQAAEASASKLERDADKFVIQQLGALVEKGLLGEEARNQYASYLGLEGGSILLPKGNGSDDDEDEIEKIRRDYGLSE